MSSDALTQRSGAVAAYSGPIWPSFGLAEILQVQDRAGVVTCARVF